ncbi:MAG: hypothetical protein LBO82_01945, partial [Synergistaceae bacterium]|nr:hypothetical protein [Synergistaceae bacterium]
TLNGGKNGAFGFGILALKGAFVVLDAVSKGSILTVSGGKANAHGLYFNHIKAKQGNCSYNASILMNVIFRLNV